MESEDEELEDADNLYVIPRLGVDRGRNHNGVGYEVTRGWSRTFRPVTPSRRVPGRSSTRKSQAAVHGYCDSQLPAMEEHLDEEKIMALVCADGGTHTVAQLS
jgi:hypothetical protein